MDVVVLYLFYPPFNLLGNRRGAARCELLPTGYAAERGCLTKKLTGDRAKEAIFGQAKGAVCRSLVCVAVRRGKLLGPY